MKYHTLFFFRKLGKMSQNLSSAAVVIGALRVKPTRNQNIVSLHGICLFCVNGHAAPYVAFQLGLCCLPKCLFTGIQNETGYILPIYQP